MSLRFKGIIQIGTKENSFISKYSRQVSNDDLIANGHLPKEMITKRDTYLDRHA